MKSNFNKKRVLKISFSSGAEQSPLFNDLEKIIVKNKKEALGLINGKETFKK